MTPSQRIKQSKTHILGCMMFIIVSAMFIIPSCKGLGTLAKDVAEDSIKQAARAALVKSIEGGSPEQIEAAALAAGLATLKTEIDKSLPPTEEIEVTESK